MGTKYPFVHTEHIPVDICSLMKFQSNVMLVTEAANEPAAIFPRVVLIESKDFLEETKDKKRR